MKFVDIDRMLVYLENSVNDDNRMKVIKSFREYFKKFKCLTIKQQYVLRMIYRQCDEF